MELEYVSLQDLIAHNKEAAIFDINKHVAQVIAKHPEYLQILRKSPEGIYIPGNIEPVVVFIHDYFYKDVDGINDRTKIQDFKNNIDEVLSSGRDIVDRSGRVVITAQSARVLKKIRKREVSPRDMLMKVGIGIVLGYLNSLCKYTSITYSDYRFDRLVKDEYLEVKYEQAMEAAFDPLLLEVRDFVGKDNYNFYFYKVKGTSLILEKSIDYRIYDWYRIKFEELEKQENYV